MTLLPRESVQAVCIDDQDRDRNHIAENRLHPIPDLHTGTGIGLFDEFVPTPAKLRTAEYSNCEGTDGQGVCRYDEIPEIKPGGSFGKRLEMENTVAQCRGNGKSKNDDAADRASLRTGRERTYSRDV